MAAFLIVLVGVFGCFIFVRSSFKQYKIRKQIHRIEMLEERNYQLYYFQLRLINRFGGDIIDVMPDYKEILYSDKPLEAKHWVDVDKLVNLN